MEGPPVSLNAKEGSPRSRRRYREWMERVRQASRSVLPSGFRLLTGEISSTITCFHTEVPPDVDNIIKPIFDGMKGVVYEDDRQIHRVTSQRYSLPRTIEVTASVAEALEQYDEVIHVVVEWEVEE